MGTRSGDIDPAVVFHMKNKDASKDEILEVEKDLNKKSGLLGICGESDMRKLIEMTKDASSEVCDIDMSNDSDLEEGKSSIGIPYVM